MCDPLTIVGAALQVGSAVANNNAAKREDRARADAMAAERIRQGQLDDESRGINAQSRNRFEGAEAQQEEASSNLAEVLTGEANRGAEVIAAALPRSNSNVTLANDTAQRTEATEFANQQGDALARMRSFADMFGGLGRDMSRDASQLGMLGGFKGGSQGVLPFELEAAASRGAGMRQAADLMGGFGGLALNAGLSGASLPRLGGRAAPRVPTAAPINSLSSLY